MIGYRKTQRGTVWWVELPKNEGSHIEYGNRPCLVVSIDRNNEHGGVVTVCPLTTQLDTLYQHPKVNCKGRVAQVLCEQLVTLDISSLGDFVWRLNQSDMNLVNNALKDQLGLGRQQRYSNNNRRW